MDDPDLPATGDSPAPVLLHRRPGLLALVFAGGAVGTAARALLTERGAQLGLGSAGATLIVNLVGCLLLGVLLETLTRRGPDAGVRRLVRLGVGTGFCGGFTTYSTLALDVALDLHGAAVWSGIGYAVASLLLGLAFVGLGVLIAPGRSRTGSATRR